MAIDWTTFTLEVVNFLVLVWLLKRFLYQPVLEVLGRRQAGVAHTLAEARRAEALEEATILLPQGANGPAFLALPNHYVIRRYNNSVSYALAIGLTADGVAGKPGLVARWPDDPPISRDQRINAQRALTQLAFQVKYIPCHR